MHTWTSENKLLGLALLCCMVLQNKPRLLGLVASTLTTEPSLQLKPLIFGLKRKILLLSHSLPECLGTIISVEKKILAGWGRVRSWREATAWLQRGTRLHCFLGRCVRPVTPHELPLFRCFVITQCSKLKETFILLVIWKSPLGAKRNNPEHRLSKQWPLDSSTATKSCSTLFWKTILYCLKIWMFMLKPC